MEVYLIALFILILYIGYSFLSKPINSYNSYKNIVLVTGGKHGLGQILAKKLNGIVIDIHKDSEYQCDVSDYESLLKTWNKIKEKHGVPNVIINNAAIVNGKTFKDLNVIDIKRSIDINLMGPINLVKIALPDLMELESAHIINIASVLGVVGVSNMTDYCASKFGVVGFHESLRQELPSRIKMSLIYPGFINTGMFSGVSHRFKWLTPELEPEYVADRIVEVVQNNKSVDLAMPLYVNLVGLIRLIPINVADFIRFLTGANDDMKKFKFSASNPNKVVNT